MTRETDLTVYLFENIVMRGGKALRYEMKFVIFYQSKI